MANIKSAKKRIDTIKRQKEENKLVKSTLATAIKKYKKALASEDFVKAEELLKETISLIDKAESKNVIHKNNASRKVARLTSALNKAKANAKTKVTADAKVEEVKEVKAEEVKEEKKTETKAKKATAKTASKTTEKSETKTAKTSKKTKADDETEKTAVKRTRKTATKKEETK